MKSRATACKGRGSLGFEQSYRNCKGTRFHPGDEHRAACDACFAAGYPYHCINAMNGILVDRFREDGLSLQTLQSVFVITCKTRKNHR
jgi:hypothetical protein